MDVEEYVPQFVPKNADGSYGKRIVVKRPRLASDVVIKPLRDDVYVELIEQRESSIILRPDYEYNPKTETRGRVLAVGPGRHTKTGTFRPSEVKVGDMVQFHFGHVMAFWPDRKHAVIDGKHVQAVLDSEAFPFGVEGI